MKLSFTVACTRTRHLLQVNAVHTVMSYFFKMHPNVILPSTFISPKWFLSSRLNYNIFVYIFHVAHASYIFIPSYVSWFGTLIIFG